MNERLGETKLNKQGTMMKIVRYGSYTDIDVEFIDDFHYIKEHQAYINFKNGGIKNPYDSLKDPPKIVYRSTDFSVCQDA